jgi:hypothetical protein
MAKETIPEHWKRIRESDAYFDADTQTKMIIKKNFAIKNIASRDDFTILPKENKEAILNNFFTVRSSDGFDLGVLRNTLLKVKENPQVQAAVKAPGENLDALNEMQPNDAQLGMAMLKGLGLLAAKGLETEGKIFHAVTEPIKKSKLEKPLQRKMAEVSQNLPAGSDAELNTMLAGAMLSFPKHLAAEVIDLVKPSTLATFAVAGPIIGATGRGAGKVISKVTPEFIKQPLRRMFSRGRGLPPEFIAAEKEAKLKILHGAEEAEVAGSKMFFVNEDQAIKLSREFITPKNMVVIKGGKKMRVKKGSKVPEGSTIMLRKGDIVPVEQQKAVGRIFRNELDTTGRRPDLPANPVRKTPMQEKIDKTLGVKEPTRSERMFKDVEVRMGFDKGIQATQAELKAISRKLGDPEGKAKALVGKKFRTETGFIEEVTEGTAKGVITKPVAPTTSSASPIPAKLLDEGEDVLRATSAVRKAPTIEAAEGATRKGLLKRQKDLRTRLEKQKMAIELETRLGYQMFDKHIAEQIIAHPKYKELAKTAKEGRDVMDKWSKALADSGILSGKAKALVEANIGSYQARLFAEHFKRKEGIGGIFKHTRLRLQGMKHRKELSTETLARLGQIEEPALALQTRVHQLSQTIANNKLLKTVANNPEWSTANKKLGDKLVAEGKMIKMPKSDALGELSEKYVIKPLARDLNSAFIAAPKQGATIGSVYRSTLSAWKFSKVVLNPATHARNMMTNTMLLDLSGVSHARQAALMHRVIKDYLEKGPMYVLAKKHGAIGGEFVGGDIKIMWNFYTNRNGSHMDKMLNTLKTPFTKAANTYQAEEQVAKMIKFTDEMAKHGNPKLAAEQAQKWLFDYQDIPNAIKIAKHVAPFITFTYKALPRVVEAAVDNPLRVYKYYALFQGWNNAAMKQLDLTPTEYAKEINALPRWLKQDIGGFPTTMLMPYRATPSEGDVERMGRGIGVERKKGEAFKPYMTRVKRATTKAGLSGPETLGRIQFLNLEYILPFGQAPDLISRELGESGFTQTAQAVIGNPYADLVIALASGKDFRGKDILPPMATKEEAMRAGLSYVYQQIAPSMMPGLTPFTDDDLKGGYGWEKLMKAMTKRRDKFDPGLLKQELTPTLFDILMGLKLTPVDPEQSMKYEIGNVQGILQDIRREYKDKIRTATANDELTPELQDEFEDVMFEKTNRLLKESTLTK